MSSLTFTAWKEVNESTKILIHKDTQMVNDTVSTNEQVSFRVGMKIPDAFGRYSSLEVAIELTGNHSINDFENFINSNIDRITGYEQTLVNAILVAGGNSPHFGAPDGKEKNTNNE